jgi:opacity protein-like surface antigen
MMKKLLTTAVAAVTLAGAAAATATPAAAQHYRGGYGGYGGYSHGYYGGHYHHDNAGPAIAAGVLGLALGAAIASNGHSSYYDRPYYGGGYYDGYYGPRWCETTRWVWDPYIGRRVPVRESYRCG